MHEIVRESINRRVDIDNGGEVSVILEVVHHDPNQVLILIEEGFSDEYLTDPRFTLRARAIGDLCQLRRWGRVPEQDIRIGLAKASVESIMTRPKIGKKRYCGVGIHEGKVVSSVVYDLNN